MWKAIRFSFLGGEGCDVIQRMRQGSEDRGAPDKWGPRTLIASRHLDLFIEHCILPDHWENDQPDEAGDRK